MAGETKNGMQCGEFEALLSDALDQVLTGARLETFQSHARVCPVCGPLFAEAEAGQHWLKSLEVVEPPINLVHNILADTIGIDTARLRATSAATSSQPSLRERIREWSDSFLRPIFGVVRQPRFAMSFGMAFFSLSIAMSVAGVKPGDLKQVDLRPSALKRSYYTTSGRIVKYYENIRFVYEIESRVREFKKVTTPAEPAPQEKDNKNHKNDTSGQPEQRQERNYSQEQNQPVLASSANDPTVVTVTMNRRFV
jgi:hypothetical protein